MKQRQLPAPQRCYDNTVSVKISTSPVVEGHLGQNATPFCDDKSYTHAVHVPSGHLFHRD
jgi:hypothetical protein